MAAAQHLQMLGHYDVLIVVTAFLLCGITQARRLSLGGVVSRPFRSAGSISFTTHIGHATTPHGNLSGKENFARPSSRDTGILSIGFRQSISLWQIAKTNKIPLPFEYESNFRVSKNKYYDRLKIATLARSIKRKQAAIADACLNHCIRDVIGGRPNAHRYPHVVPSASTARRSIAASDRDGHAVLLRRTEILLFSIDWPRSRSASLVADATARLGCRPRPIDRPGDFSGLILPCDTEKSLHCPRLSWRVPRRYLLFAVVLAASI